MTASTAALVRHVLDTPTAAIPEGAIRKAKVFTLDTLGVGVAGATAPYAGNILKVARGWGAPRDRAASARILGRNEWLPPASAAYVNAFQIHCQEFDCVHEPAVVHPMATAFAALLAEIDAQVGATPGADFVAAVALAVDVSASLGVAAKSPIRFFRPATAGVFGATLGVARLRGFPFDRALDALGHALGQCAGVMQAHVEGKPTLPLQIAGAARAAIIACDLAEAGVPGPHDVFEGPYGYFPLFEQEWDLKPIIAALGGVWRIEEVSHKPFPTGRAAQGGVVAMQKLREMGAAAPFISSVSITAPPLIRRLVGRPYKERMDANYARLCFQYIGARTLLDGTVGLGDFTREKLDSAEIASLASRISIVDDGVSGPAAFTPQIATATLVDGSTLGVRIEALYGSPADPMSVVAHERKFRECLTSAGYPEIAAERAIDCAGRLENISDTRALASCLEKS